MLSVVPSGFGVYAALMISAPSPVSGDAVESSFFEGRWAFAEESCDVPTNWTFLADGNFRSENLTGAWQWMEGRLELNLTDLAVDEETGETGGRFQMEGPVTITGQDGFSFLIEPDRYDLKRCK